MKICLIDTYHAFHFEVLEKLKQTNNITFSYAITGTQQNFHGDIDKIKELMNYLFDEKTIIDQVSDFLFPSNINQFIIEKWSVNEQLIKYLKETESYFLRLTDRNSSFPISVHNRRQYYLILLNHFNNIFENNNFDSVITFDTPHSFSSYLFYKLAEYHGISLIKLEQHFLQHHSLILSYENPKLPDNYYKAHSTVDLYNKLPDALKIDLNTYNSSILQANKNEKSALLGKSRLSGLKLGIRFIIKASANIIMGIFPFLFKQEILHFTSLNGIRSRFLYRLKINVPLLKLMKLNHFYNKISVQPDLTKNYIFFGMHMQPEKTSQPLGGEYDHQILPITIISNSLPKGWVLYIKEHPNQFNKRKIANQNYRSREFYQAVLRLKNIKFVSLNISSSELIQNARIVSTLTGTLGWEGLISGKPVIAFGNSYYKACEAVRSPKSVKDCIIDIKELSSLSADDIQKEIYRYLLYYFEKELLVEASNSEEVIAKSDLSRKKQIENLAALIGKKLNNSCLK